MNIKTVCPVCKAQNVLNRTNTQCRRCNADLSLQYTVKLHSYIHRLNAINALINKDYQAVKASLHKARSLVTNP